MDIGPAVLYLYLLGTITYIRHLHLTHITFNRQYVVTVQIGHSTTLSTDGLDRRSNHRLTLFVNNMTLDGLVLSLNRQGKYQTERHHDISQIFVYLGLHNFYFLFSNF